MNSSVMMSVFLQMVFFLSLLKIFTFPIRINAPMSLKLQNNVLLPQLKRHRSLHFKFVWVSFHLRIRCILRREIFVPMSKFSHIQSNTKCEFLRRKFLLFFCSNLLLQNSGKWSTCQQILDKNRFLRGNLFLN
jgi:hypothetical protein